MSKRDYRSERRGGRDDFDEELENYLRHSDRVSHLKPGQRLDRERNRSPERSRRRSRSRSPDRSRRRNSRERRRSRDRGGRNRSRSNERRRGRDMSRERGRRERSRSVSISRKDKTGTNSRFQDKVEPKEASHHSKSDVETNVDQEPEQGNNDDDDMMKAMFGIASFDTTKGKHVAGNEVSGANVKKQRHYRQYMNRKGGFNRALDG